MPIGKIVILFYGMRYIGRALLFWLLSYALHRKPEYSRKVTDLRNSNSYSGMVVLNQTNIKYGVLKLNW